MNRIVLPELLDVLPPQDASALRSRRDLRRVNGWMGHPQIMSCALRQNWLGGGVQELVELGAGDGHFLLSVARRLRPPLSATATLVDRLEVLDPQVRAQFGRCGWQVQAATAEATQWLRHAPPGNSRMILGNLFFHQFHPAPLGEMLRLAAAASRLFIAVEPRRSWLARLTGGMLWAIGCGPVTRHDARISIHAGFAGREISELWPDRTGWELTERSAGLFSHLFIARRRD